jgi:hypothetical protein
MTVARLQGLSTAHAIQKGKPNSLLRVKELRTFTSKAVRGKRANEGEEMLLYSIDAVIS